MPPLPFMREKSRGKEIDKSTMNQKKYSAGNIFAKGVIGNVRKAQEDCHSFKLDTPNGDLFVVCDGMGGHVGGAKASNLAVDSIVEYINKEKYATPIDALNGALQFANMQILGFADANPEYKGMGTTACILLLRDDGAWIAHVGDSRIYLYLGKEKKLHRITKDHSYVQTLVDAGEITDEQAEHHPNKNRILKALGIKPDLTPTFNFEKRPILPKRGDIFLICSDGLSGMIPDGTIQKVLGQDITLAQKGERLIDLAMQGETVVPGGQDNCTLELIEVDNSKVKKSVFHSYNPHQGPQKTQKKGANLRKIERILIIAVVVLAVGLGALVLLKPNNGGANNDDNNSGSTTPTTATVSNTGKGTSTMGLVANLGEGDEGDGTPAENDSIIAAKRVAMIDDSVKIIGDNISKWNKKIKELELEKERIKKNITGKGEDGKKELQRLKDETYLINRDSINPADAKRKKLKEEKDNLIKTYNLKVN